MRFLPREHGATAIWFTSIILGIALLRDWPSPVGLSIFIAVSFLALAVLGQLTGSSTTLLRLERNRIILPLSSGSLTILVPLGGLICMGHVPRVILAVWILFITYIVGAVAYTQAAVRSIKDQEHPNPADIALPLSAILILESVTLDMSGWLDVSSILVLIPLFMHLMLVRRSHGKEVPMRKAIRMVGFTQAAAMIAVAAVLAIVSRM